MCIVSLYGSISGRLEKYTLRITLTLVHGVLAGQPMTDDEAGLDSDWTLALRTGNDHEFFTAYKNTHRHSDTHA